MALIKCHECKSEVSTEAKTCPQCGAKVKKPMSLVMKVVLGFIGISVVVGIVTSNRQDVEKAQAKASRTPEQVAAEKARDAQLQFAAIGAIQLKKAMKDPQAFDLTSLYVTKSGYACYEYRAKNSFGAIFPASAVLTSDGKMFVQEKHENEFVKAWNRECTKKGGDDIAALVKRRILEN